jgi:formamidopyrimidine-DNA glycosylase
MPELPEVEVYKEQFESFALHKQIENVEVWDNKILLNTSEDELNSLLKNKEFVKAERLGKYLCLQVSDKKCLEVHFGMTGYFSYLTDGDIPDSTRAIFRFKDGSRLAYVDKRKIGHLSRAESLETLKVTHMLGMDALSVSENDFVTRISSQKSKIKAVLMDQTIISGVGDVYADEILFQARIHPESKANAIGKEKLHETYRLMRMVLMEAIEYVRSTETYEKARKKLPSNFLIPVRKEKNADCPGCHGKINQIQVAGRSTYFCPSCQKLYE